MQLSLPDPVMDPVLQENSLNADEVAAASTCGAGVTGNSCAGLGLRAPRVEMKLVATLTPAVCTCEETKPGMSRATLLPGVVCVTEPKGRIVSELRPLTLGEAEDGGFQSVATPIATERPVQTVDGGEYMLEAKIVPAEPVPPAKAVCAGAPLL